MSHLRSFFLWFLFFTSLITQLLNLFFSMASIVENVNIQGNPVIDAAGQQIFPEPLPSTDPRTYPENEVQGYNSNMYGYRTFKNYN